MNIIPNSTRAAITATHSLSTYFADDAEIKASTRAGRTAGRDAAFRSTMGYYGKRVPYASALYAAAVAALLSACSPAEVELAPEATSISTSETASDLPEVVITASRERPKTNG